MAGYGDAARESVAAAALQWLSPACLAGYANTANESITVVTLRWLPSVCVAGYGDNNHENRGIVGLIDSFWECVWALALDGFTQSEFRNQGSSWDS